LAYSLIIISIMIVIVSSLSVVTVIEKKSAVSTDSSVQAYQVADSGVQVAIKEINKIIATGNSSSTAIGSVFTNCVNPNSADGNIFTGAEYKLSFFSDGGGTQQINDCNEKIDKIQSIKSVGTYKNTVRAVQVVVAEKRIKSNSDLMILIDFSGSVTDSDRDKEKNAAIDLINNLGLNCKVGVSFFSSTVESYPLTPIADKIQVINFINSNNLAKGGTVTSEAIKKAKEELLGPNGRHSTNPQAILLITDGIPHNGGDTTLNIACAPSLTLPPVPTPWYIESANFALEASTEAKNSGISILVIGAGLDNLISQECRDKAKELMEDIATTPANYTSIDDFSELKKALDELT